MTPCSLIDIYPHLEQTCFLRLQNGAVSRVQKAGAQGTKDSYCGQVRSQCTALPLFHTSQNIRSSVYYGPVFSRANYSSSLKMVLGGSSETLVSTTHTTQIVFIVTAVITPYSPSPQVFQDPTFRKLVLPGCTVSAQKIILFIVISVTT
jgi:hypothetical protein